MQQVNMDELVHLIVGGLRDVKPSVLKQMQDGRYLVAGQGRYVAAEIFAAKLGRLEILSSAPEPPGFRRPGQGAGAAFRMEDED